MNGSLVRVVDELRWRGEGGVRGREGGGEGAEGGAGRGERAVCTLDMFSTMRAQLRLIEVVGSSKPRLRSGAITASADEKISWTKITPASLWTVSATLVGSRMQPMISGTKPLMSLFVIVAHASFIACVAASLTCETGRGEAGVSGEEEEEEGRGRGGGHGGAPRPSCPT